MLRCIIFKLLDIWRICKPRNWQIICQDTFTDGTQYTEYFYNGSKFIHIGDFQKRPHRFSMPIKLAKLGDRDVTHIVKTYGGPLCNCIPSTGYIFHKIKYVFKFTIVKFGLRILMCPVRHKGHDVEIKVYDILGQESVLGAR